MPWSNIIYLINRSLKLKKKKVLIIQNKIMCTLSEEYKGRENLHGEGEIMLINTKLQVILQSNFYSRCSSRLNIIIILDKSIVISV